MLRAEDYYDILAENERLIEDARYSQRRAFESPKNAQLQERYLQQANSLGLIPARFCSPTRRQFLSPRSSAAKPTTSLSLSPRSPNLVAHTSLRMRPVPSYDYAYGPHRPSRDKVARELARADASMPCNSAAAALAATSALSKRHPTPRSRPGSGTPWRRTVSCPGYEDVSSRGSWETRSIDSDSSTYSVASKHSVCNSTSTATASEISFSMSPSRRGASDKSSRDVGSGSGLQGNSNASEVGSPRPRQSRQDSAASADSAKMEAVTSSGKWRESLFGDGSRGGLTARSSSDGGWWSQRLSCSSGQSSGLLMEPTESFLRRWRSVKKKQNAKKQAVRFLLRTLDEGDLGGDNGRGASPPRAPHGAAAATTTSHRLSSGGGDCSTGGGQKPWGPGVVIVYPGSTVAFPAHPLPYSFSEALEAASTELQLHAPQQQQQPPASQMQHATSPWEPRYQVPPSYPPQQDLREGGFWGAPSPSHYHSVPEPPPYGVQSSVSARQSGSYLASVPERTSQSAILSSGLRNPGQPEDFVDVAPSAPLQYGMDAPMQSTFSQQQRPLPEYGQPQRQAWIDTPNGQQYAMYDADMECDTVPVARNDFNSRQEMSAAQRAAIARISTALQFFSGGGAGCDSGSRDGWPWVHGRGSPGAAVSVSAGGASSSHSEAFPVRTPSAYERLSVSSARFEPPLHHHTSSLHSDVSAVSPAPGSLSTSRTIPHNQTPFGLMRSQRGVVAEQSRFVDSPRSGSGGGSGGGSGSGGGGVQRTGPSVFGTLGSPGRPVQEAWADVPSPVPTQAYSAHHYNSHHYNTVAEWAAAAAPGMGVGGDVPADTEESLQTPGPGGPLYSRFGNEALVAPEAATAMQGPDAGSIGGRSGYLGDECPDVQSPITAQTMQLLRDQQVVISRDVQALLKRVADIRGRLRA